MRMWQGRPRAAAVVIGIFGMVGMLSGIAAWPIARGVEEAATVVEAPSVRAPIPQAPLQEHVLERLRSNVEWLAAPEREGRGPGTAGIEAAAEWVGEQFVDLGLTTAAEATGPFQPFEMTLDAKLGPPAENTA